MPIVMAEMIPEPASGGPMSYAADLWIHTVQPNLKGEKPADLPIQQPTKFELLINLKTACMGVWLRPPPSRMIQLGSAGQCLV
jgi:putative ABC transport system substrate-binding protein